MTKNLVKVWNVPLKNGKIIKVATIEQGERKPSMCDGCSSPCCKGILMPVLTGEEFLSRRFQFAYSPVPDWLKEKVPNAEFLATLDVKENGCPYHIDNKCTIWPNCPKSCTTYDCREDPRMTQFVKEREKQW